MYEALILECLSNEDLKAETELEDFKDTQKFSLEMTKYSNRKWAPLGGEQNLPYEPVHVDLSIKFGSQECLKSKQGE